MKNRNTNFFFRKETNPETNPAIRREDLASQVETFLKAGGKVQRLPSNPPAEVIGRAYGVGK